MPGRRRRRARSRPRRSPRSPTRRPRARRSSTLAAERGIRFDAAAGRRGRAVHRADPHVAASTSPTARSSARAPARRSSPGSSETARSRRAMHDELDQRVDAISVSGGTPLVVATEAADGDGAHPRRRPPEGHRQGRARRALRRAARDGHPHRDDHGRQPAHRQGDRGRGRRRRLPRRGHARGQDRADPQRSRRAATSSR